VCVCVWAGERGRKHTQESVGRGGGEMKRIWSAKIGLK
jgi:hypothetical protein